jgi:hypothetical protein
MMRTYPNFELLEYRFGEELLKTHDPNTRYIPDNDCFVFPQTWPNTGGGFARKGFCYGQAMTTEYTTVIINRQDNAALVCFGNRPAYFVKPITDRFMHDLKNHNMAGVEKMNCYGEVKSDASTDD